MRMLLAGVTALLFLLAACSDTANDAAQRATSQPSVAPSVVASPDSSSAGVRRAPQVFDPASFTLELAPFLSGLRNPLFVTAPADGSDRIFVVEQGGTIRIAQSGQVLPQPFLDVSSLIVSGGEQGLLGLAFHPRYRENGI